MMLAARRSPLRTRILLIVTMVISLSLTGCPPQADGGKSLLSGKGEKRFSHLPFKEPEPTAPDPASVWPPRAIWVVRQEWKSPEQITSLMESIKNAGLNTVLFQVRGNGTVYYRSAVEPFAYDDPGFDPLQIACREAHRRGLALQAWVNVMPAWKGLAPPTDPRQLYNARPDWFWYDQHGRRQPLNSAIRPVDPWYVSLNPCLPDVRQYLVSVFSEIVQKYPVDGLQLDYIRFPRDECPRGSDYPYDTKTLSLYRQATGKRPQDDKRAWTAWRIRQVTQLVREVRQMTRNANRTVRLTASCGAAFEAWRPDYFQDGPSWLREKLVDLVFVMNYTNEKNTFVRRQQAWHQAAPGCWIAAGIDVFGETNHPKSNAAIIEQLQRARDWGHGFALFAATGLFSGQSQEQARLQSLRPILLSMRPSPSAMQNHPGAIPLASSR